MRMLWIRSRYRKREVQMDPIRHYRKGILIGEFVISYVLILCSDLRSLYRRYVADKSQITVFWV